LDLGDLVVTNVRLIFKGSSHVREVPFARLLSYEYPSARHFTAFESGSRTPLRTRAPGIEIVFRYRLPLALAHFSGERPVLVQALQSEIEAAGRVEQA
jgi:hypothetical protein